MLCAERAQSLRSLFRLALSAMHSQQAGTIHCYGDTGRVVQGSGAFKCFRAHFESFVGVTQMPEQRKGFLMHRNSQKIGTGTEFLPWLNLRNRQLNISERMRKVSLPKQTLTQMKVRFSQESAASFPARDFQESALPTACLLPAAVQRVPDDRYRDRSTPGTFPPHFQFPWISLLSA